MFAAWLAVLLLLLNGCIISAFIVFTFIMIETA